MGAYKSVPGNVHGRQNERCQPGTDRCLPEQYLGNITKEVGSRQLSVVQLNYADSMITFAAPAIT